MLALDGPCSSCPLTEPEIALSLPLPRPEESEMTRYAWQRILFPRICVRLSFVFPFLFSNAKLIRPSPFRIFQLLIFTGEVSPKSSHLLFFVQTFFLFCFLLPSAPRLLLPPIRRILRGGGSFFPPLFVWLNPTTSGFLPPNPHTLTSSCA